MKTYHEKRSFAWNAKRGKRYNLVYYRPVLFFGANGYVGVQGQVGSMVFENGKNIERESNHKEDEDDEKTFNHEKINETT